MRCVRCNRPLGISTVTVRKGAVSFFWGPTCAKRAGIFPPVQRSHRILNRAAEREVDPHQIELFGVAA